MHYRSLVPVIKAVSYTYSFDFNRVKSQDPSLRFLFFQCNVCGLSITIYVLLCYLFIHHHLQLPQLVQCKLKYVFQCHPHYPVHHQHQHRSLRFMNLPVNLPSSPSRSLPPLDSIESQTSSEFSPCESLPSCCFSSSSESSAIPTSPSRLSQLPTISSQEIEQDRPDLFSPIYKDAKIIFLWCIVCNHAISELLKLLSLLYPSNELPKSLYSFKK